MSRRIPQSAGTTPGAPCGTQTFLIRVAIPPLAQDDSLTRGLVGAIGRKVLQILAFRALEVVGGVAGPWVAGRGRLRTPYRVRRFDMDTYRNGDAPDLGTQWWADAGLSEKPVLLMLHGTFSRTHSCFGGFSPDMVADLNIMYEGKVAGFDHFTLSRPGIECRRIHAAAARARAAQTQMSSLIPVAVWLLGCSPKGKQRSLSDREGSGFAK